MKLKKSNMIIISIIVVVLITAPMCFLWSMNSLSELGGSTFYIKHSLWSYLVSIVFLSSLNVLKNK